MASFLTTTFVSQTTTVIPSTPESRARDAAAAVALIHDHAAVLTMNPFVVDHELLSTQNTAFPPPDEGPLPPPSNSTDVWRTYRVLEEIPRFGGLWKQKLEYVAGLMNHEKGFRSETNPGGGVHLEGSWVIEESENGELVLIETTEVTCNMLLVPLIKFSLKSGHDEIHQRFLERLGKTKGH